MDEFNAWEARSARRYGSQHEGWFPSERAARSFAENKIKEAGGAGRITAVRNNVLYFDEFEELT